LAKKNITVASHGVEEFTRQRQHYANGMGGLLIVGDADRVANTLAELSNAGLNGMAISFINYLDELDFFHDEVIGRLERMGLREGRTVPQARSA
jgi:alkanesulfonate monooxygenase SsuD/methylene tetrahydromethanopterin reductase-like flavin-dependent oxidoreductase (luciferase family)